MANKDVIKVVKTQHVKVLLEVKNCNKSISISFGAETFDNVRSHPRKGAIPSPHQLRVASPL